MEGPFFFLVIQSDQSSGKNSIKELINMAQRLKWDAIAISDFVLNKEDLIRIKSEIRKIDSNIDVFLGAKIKAENVKDLEKRVKNLREYADIIIVHGGELEINRRACEMPEVDILAHPELNRKDSGLDHVMARLAHTNHVAIEINFENILSTHRRMRSQVLAKYNRNILLCQKMGASIICCSGAESIYDMRSPREYISFLQTQGMSIDRAIETISKVPESIIRRAYEVRSESFIRPGLKRVDSGESQ